VLKPAVYAAAGVPCYWRVETGFWSRWSRYQRADGGFREGGWVSAGSNALAAPYDVVIDAVALSAP